MIFFLSINYRKQHLPSLLLFVISILDVFILYNVSFWFIKTTTALMYDAVELFAKALKELTVAQTVTTQSLSCDKKETWTFGNSLLNYMKSVNNLT